MAETNVLHTYYCVDVEPDAGDYIRFGNRYVVPKLTVVPAVIESREGRDLVMDCPACGLSHATYIFFQQGICERTGVCTRLLEFRDDAKITVHRSSTLSGTPVIILAQRRFPFTYEFISGLADISPNYTKYGFSSKISIYQSEESDLAEFADKLDTLVHKIHPFPRLKISVEAIL